MSILNKMRILASSPGKRQLCGYSAQPSFSAGHTATSSEPRTRRPPDREPLTRRERGAPFLPSSPPTLRRGRNTEGRPEGSPKDGTSHTR
eukprot:bmy_06188T0